jgi:hypothetical protein
VNRTDLSRKEQKIEIALDLAASGRVQRQGSGWIVRSHTDNFYWVKADATGRLSCTCADHVLNQRTCKHCWAVRFAQRS